VDVAGQRQARVRDVTPRRLLLAGVGASAVLAVAAWPLTAASAADRAQVQPFRGIADASGMRVTMKLAGATVTDTPLDGGGPTASAIADSTGGGLSYAAFPDPGQFYVGAPSLATGLLSLGAGGLPPLPVPSLPQYPFAVQADANTGHQEIDGGGPYRLSATSDETSSLAEATSGFQSGVTGAAALATSTSSVRPTDDGIVSTGATDVRGFSFGPLTVGRVLSSATTAMDPSGTVTPSFDLQVFGLQIGNTPVSFTSSGFSYGGAPQPVDLSPAQQALLDNAGIRLEVVQPEKLRGGTTAPALRVTFPLDGSRIPGAEGYQGTVAVTFGYAFSTLEGAATAGSTSAAVGPDTGALPSAPSPGAVDAAGLGVLPSTALVPVTAPVAGAQAIQPAGARAGVPRLPPQMDIDILYVLVGAGALLAFAVGPLVTGRGLRSWSSAGS
jgi:hypothetical protein